MILDPQGYLDEVCEHLGMQRHTWSEDQLRRRHNQLPYGKNQELSDYLHKLYAPRVEELKRAMPELVELWRMG
jgi:hypothetical protein